MNETYPNQSHIKSNEKYLHLNTFPNMYLSLNIYLKTEDLSYLIRLINVLVYIDHINKLNQLTDRRFIDYAFAETRSTKRRGIIYVCCWGLINISYSNS
jgi:hypothetical protein